MLPGTCWEVLPTKRTRSKLVVGKQEVMKKWETPLMRRMAQLLCASVRRKRIVEVGFGMGIAAAELEAQDLESHIIIEPHPETFQRLVAWRKKRASADIRPVNDYWQNVPELFDTGGIFFDTYAPTLDQLIAENVSFLETAAERLRPGAGVALFWIHPTIDDRQQLVLYRRFSRVIVEPVALYPRTTTVKPLAEAGFLLAIVAIK